jgi:hypothetical protein
VDEDHGQRQRRDIRGRRPDRRRDGGEPERFPHIAVNSNGDFILGYSRFGSTQHPSAGYSIHIAADGLGVMRDPLIYKAGEDYYHKTFTTATGRNRWGDFSTAQVDPSDDRSLWTLQDTARRAPGPMTETPDRIPAGGHPSGRR